MSGISRVTQHLECVLGLIPLRRVIESKKSFRYTNKGGTLEG